MFFLFWSTSSIFLFFLLSFLLSLPILLHRSMDKVPPNASSSYYLQSFNSRNRTTCCLYNTLFVSNFSFLPFIIYLLLFVLCVLLFVKYSNVKLQFFFVFNYWVDIILVSFFQLRWFCSPSTTMHLLYCCLLCLNLLLAF